MRQRRNRRWYYRKWIRTPDGAKVRVFGVPSEFGLPNTKTGAQEAERRKVNAILGGQPIRVEVAPKVKTVDNFKSTFLEHSRAKNASSTVDSKEQILDDHIIPAIGHLPLDKVTFAVIEDLKHALLDTRANADGTKRKGLKAKTVNNVLTVLRRMLALAAKRGLIAGVPEIEWLKTERPEFDFLDFGEAPRLIAAGDQEWGTMIIVALRAGLRQSELLALRWDDVDLVAGRLTVRRAYVRGKFKAPKNGKPREIALGDDVIAALKRHRHLRGELVFCDMGGAVLSKGECKHPLWRACKRAGLRRIGWHVLRHTFASHLVMKGATIKAVQELMGHATIQMTMRYAHLSPHIARDAVRLLDDGAQPVPNPSGLAHTR